MQCTHIEWFSSRSTGFIELVYLINFHHFSCILPLNQQTVSSSSFSHANTNVDFLFVYSYLQTPPRCKYLNTSPTLIILSRKLYRFKFGLVCVITILLHLLFAYVVDAVGACECGRTSKLIRKSRFSAMSDVLLLFFFFQNVSLRGENKRTTTTE